MIGRNTAEGSLAARRKAGFDQRNLMAAAVTAVLMLLVVLFVFGRHSVLKGGSEIAVEFQSGNQLKSGSSVRVAGLDVGKVESVKAQEEGRALVKLRLDDSSPELHGNARFDIKARLAFEGNFYVDVDPGTTDAGRLRGGVVPIEQTSIPVQLDQVFDVFTGPVRKAAAGTAGELAAGLGGGSTLSAPPGVSSGAAGLRDATDELDRSLTSITGASKALRGTERDDLAKAVTSTGTFASTLSRDPRALASIITNFNRTVAALASSDNAMQRTISAADGVMRTAPTSLTRIDNALPDLRRFSAALRPALAAIPGAARSGSNALDQVEAFTSKRELRRTVASLNRPVRDLPVLQEGLQFATPLVTAATKCIGVVVVPAISQVVPDGKLTTGVPAWLDFMHMASSLATGSQGFDANGSTYRAGLGQGEFLVQGLLPGGQEITGTIGQGKTGLRPQWLGPGKTPQKRPDVPCATQKVPNLETESTVPFAGLDRRPNPKLGQSPQKTQESVLAGLRTLRDSLKIPLLTTPTRQREHKRPAAPEVKKNLEDAVSPTASRLPKPSRIIEDILGLSGVPKDNPVQEGLMGALDALLDGGGSKTP